MSITARQEEVDCRRYEYMVSNFLKKYRPADSYQADCFDRDLHVLIRQIFLDAQAPALDRLTQLVMRMPTAKL